MFWMTRQISEEQKKYEEVNRKWNITFDEGVKKYGSAMALLQEMGKDLPYLKNISVAQVLLIAAIDEVNKRLERLENREDEHDYAW